MVWCSAWHAAWRAGPKLHAMRDESSPHFTNACTCQLVSVMMRWLFNMPDEQDPRASSLSSLAGVEMEGVNGSGNGNGNGNNRATWSTSNATDDGDGDGDGGGAMHELERNDSTVSDGQADGGGEGEGEGEGTGAHSSIADRRLSRSGSRALDAPLPPPDARQNAIRAMMAMAGGCRSHVVVAVVWL